MLLFMEKLRLEWKNIDRKSYLLHQCSDMNSRQRKELEQRWMYLNCGNATAAQVLYLIKTIQQAVEKRYHVELEPEVRLVGL